MTATSKIAKLVPKKTTQHEGVIKTLENMLVAAKEDGLTGIAIAGVDAEGFTHSAFEQGASPAALLGAMTYLQHRLLKHADDD